MHLTGACTSQEHASHRRVSYRRVSHRGMHLTGVHPMNVPLSWASLPGLSRGHASVSAPKPVSSASTPEPVSPTSVPYLRPLPLPLPLSLPQGLGALSAHCLSRATTLFQPDAARGSLAGVETCR